MIFVNLPSGDLERSKAFYTALGCEINPLFTDENAACVVWDENTYFMMLSRSYFPEFSAKSLIDPQSHIQTLVAFMFDSRDKVDSVVSAGLGAGGTEGREPQDLGFMYQRSLDDPDGNTLEFGYMDPKAAEMGPEAFLAEGDS